MAIETKRTRKESLPSTPAYWVRFRDVTYEDVTAILDIFKEKTGKTPFPIEKEDYKRLRRKFYSEAGYVERQIGVSSYLEWRRLVDEQERTFIRFKITGVDVPNSIRPENSIQIPIDNYFIAQNKAIPASVIFSAQAS